MAGRFGLKSNAGSVPSALGQPPVAVVDSSVSSGLAPLAVNFSSARSYDPEGSSLTCDWDFGDGGSSLEFNPSHTYTTPGTYTASLVVFDASGLSGTASTVITVQNPANIVYVSGITMSKTTSSRGTQATATVTVKDAAGNLKPNVTVTGAWSGLTSGTASAMTSAAGTAAITSGGTKKNGTFTFTVTGLTLAGATYDASRNLQTSASIVK